MSYLAELAGDRTKARGYYSRLAKICERGDPNARPDLERARQYISTARI